jgi:hypothetical protein
MIVFFIWGLLIIKVLQTFVGAFEILYVLLAAVTLRHGAARLLRANGNFVKIYQNLRICSGRTGIL